MPKVYMLVGVPGSGKSTWIANQPFDWNNTVILSTDNYIERVAKSQGKTYSDIFQDTIKDAEANLQASLKDAIKNGHDIIWDQTNTTAKNRQRKLQSFPKEYEKIGVMFPVPASAELKRRLGNRPGKNIPDHVMQSMISSLQEPTEAEGFDKIIHVR